MKKDLQDLLQSALSALAKDLEIELPDIDKINIDNCKNPNHGDFATNLALALAKALKMAPRELAESIVAHLPENSLIDSTSIAGPGFINFFVSQQSQMTVVKEILANPESYGQSERKNHKVQVEFVSANPTGPLHVGHGRGAAIGDAICRILEADGYSVTKEFYYNDAGQQIDNLARSVQLRCQGVEPGSADWPEDGYRGDYILDLAKSYLNKDTISDIADSDPVSAVGDPEDSSAIRQFAVAYLRREQDLDLKAFDVEFDVFSLESALYADGTVESTVEKLISSGHCYEEDGALWLRSTAFGDDKDRVMRKKTGGFTYFVPDVAYHHQKWIRGFSTVINEQGSDHHGTIARVRAGLQALDVGIPADWPAYVLHQMVMVTKGGEEVKISKRAGSYVTLRDLIDQVGKDATRYFLCSRRADSQLTFDIDLALERSNENPVFYIQYAHARICSALENASERFDRAHSLEQGLANLDRLNGEEELALARQLARYPEVLKLASRERAPYVIANYLKELAGDLHGWYASGNQDKSKQLLVDNETVRDARLCLASATKIVLATGMQLLGVSAPNRM